jgi:hypothetical protein
MRIVASRHDNESAIRVKVLVSIAKCVHGTEVL